MKDYSEQFQNTILQAREQKEPVAIKGGGSKDFYGREIKGTALHTAEHRGIVNYEPKELVVTVRCGTSLSELEAELAQQGQMLAFEPPHFTDKATIGGVVACGFSGSRRPYAGSARDFVLGTRIINGRGEILRFGGEVMKNVAGYDVSRLMVGALGTLGLMLDVSLKVLPIPEQEKTTVLECSAEDAIRLMNEWAGSTLPLSAACYADDRLYLRLSGASAAVVAGSKRLGGEILRGGAGFWSSINQQRHDFFNSSHNDGEALWRLSLPADTPQLDLIGKQLIDWGGAQRWFIADNDEQNIRQIVEAHGGHAALFRGGDRRGEIFHPLKPALATLHRHLKYSFDPQGILNPGRIYQAL